VHRDIFL